MSGCESAPGVPCSSCGESSPGLPNVTGEFGDQGFQANFPMEDGPAGIAAGSLSWEADDLADGVSLDSVFYFPGVGTSQHQDGGRWQIKSANSLVDLQEGQSELTIRWYGPGQISPDPLDDAFETPSGDPVKAVTFSLGTVLQILTEEGGEPVGVYELDYNSTSGTRTWTNLTDGSRFVAVFTQPSLSERVIVTEEWRRKLDGVTFELISRTRQAYAGLTEFLLTESIVDPITADRPQGAHLVTSYSYRWPSSSPVTTSYPDGSWVSRSLRELHNDERIELVGADGEIDRNFDSMAAATYYIDAVTYRPWLDSPFPGPNGVPDIDECVAELEIRFEGAIYGKRRETRVLGKVTAIADTLFTDVTDDLDVYTVRSETTWASQGNVRTVSQSWTAKSGPLAGPLAGKVVKTIDEHGVTREFDYTPGDFSIGTGFTPNASGGFLRVREWDTKQAVGKSTRTSRVEDPEGKTVERLLESWNGSGWDLMVTDHWDHDALHLGASVTEHFTNGVLVGRNAETATTSTSWSAGGPVVTTVNDSSYETTSMTEDYPGTTPDITTTYSRDGRKEIVTRAAGELVETTITERNVAGRVVSRTDERGITTLTSYSDGGRTTTTTRPGGITETSTTYLDGQMKSLSGSGVIPAFWTYAVDGTTGFLSTTTYVGSTDDSSPRWSTEVSDWSGRTVQSIRPSPSGTGNVTDTRHYDPDSGALVKIVSTGRADRLFTQDEFGRNVSSGLDLDADGELNPESTDRMTVTEQACVEIGGRWWNQTTTSVFHTDENGEDAYVTIHRSALAPIDEDGSARWTSVVLQPGGLTLTTHRDESVGSATVVESTDSSATTASPGSTATSVAGRLLSYSEFGATEATTFDHDAFGRQTLVTDPRGGTTRMIYNIAGQVTQQIDHARNTTVIDYYPANHPSAGLQQRVSNPELESTEYTYNSRGQLTEVSGNGTYPLSYGYDTYGDLHTLITYASGGTGDTTTWIRDPATGVVLQKLYADQNGTTYTYHPTGEVHTRTWQRGVTTTYTYNPARDLTGIDYSDPTPDVTLVPDRLGRPAEITDGGGTLVRTYHEELPVPANDEYAATHAWLPGVTVEHAWTAATAQRLHTGARRDTTWDQKSDYLHDPATGRLEKINGPGFVHRYEYAPGTSLITGINHRNTADTQTIAREIRRTDLAGRLYGIETRGENDAVRQRHGYRHDKAGRRVRATREDGSYWAYGYNDRGEVISGNKHLPDGTPLAGQQFGYDYDALGNRNWAKSGGDANGENLRTITYEANALNQYTEIVSPGSFDVIGRAPANDTVTVNSQATLRQGDRFRAEITADNATTAVWQDITVSDGTPPDIEGNRYLPKATVTPNHDLDGNLLFDGRWDYVWDAENRLVSMTTNPTAQATGEPYRKLVFSYDWMGKRIRKQVFDTPTTTTPFEDLRFAYDGWNLIAEYTSTGGILALDRGYTCGTDLSNTEQGAGGVGGLLSVWQGGASYAASNDGNGNVVGWVNSSGLLAAMQEFDPFGNRIIHEGSVDMDFGFSTKYEDKETGLLYYGYRYNDPVTGRWLSTDPIGEQGGSNLFSINRNDNVGFVDILGLTTATARGAIDTALTYYLDESVNSGLGDRTGFNEGFLKLLSLSGYSAMNIGDDTFSKVYQTVTNGRASSFYSRPFRIIYLSPGETNGRILHEVIHAWNDLSGNPAAGTLDDEAMAYLGENGVNAVVDNVFQLIKDIGRFSCVDLKSRDVLNARWGKGMWDAREEWSSPGWGTAVLGSESRPINKIDFVKLKESIGLNFSCEAMADYINVLLWRKNCCMRVRCTAPLFRIDEDGYYSHGTNKAIEIEY